MKERSIFNLKYTFGNLTFNLNNIFDDTYQRPHGYNQGGRNAKLQYWLYF